MDSFNKAKEYADGKVVEALNQVVADAYQAGYNAGYQDGINKVVKDSALEKTEYVDLGLPSGTLWASSYVEDEKGNAVYLTQEESKAYNLPTLEQWDELRRRCKWNENSEKNWTEYGNYYYHSWAICLGPNGNKITFELTGLYEEFSFCSQTGEALFWLKDSDGCGRNSAKITLNDLELDTNSTFSGYKLCLRTVK